MIQTEFYAGYFPGIKITIFGALEVETELCWRKRTIDGFMAIRGEPFTIVDFERIGFP